MDKKMKATIKTGGKMSPVKTTKSLDGAKGVLKRTLTSTPANASQVRKANPKNLSGASLK